MPPAVRFQLLRAVCRLRCWGQAARRPWHSRFPWGWGPTRLLWGRDIPFGPEGKVNKPLTWRLLLSHTLSHGGSPSVFPDKIHLVPSIKNLYFFCCSRTGYCAFIPLPAVVLIIQTLILWYLEQLWPVSCPYISAIIVTIGGGHPSQGTSHLKIFFKNYPDYLGQIPNFLISYSLLTLQLLCVNFSAFISPFSASVCPTAVSPFPISSLDLLDITQAHIFIL